MRRFTISWPSLTAVGVLLAAALQALETNAPAPPMPRPQDVTARIRKHHLSPVEFFRVLLGMSPAERERALAGRTPDDKAILLAKLQEYEALPRPIREARLCQTELHWELADLMKLAPEGRSNRLKEVSARYRPMIDDLLRQWDAVPAATQRELLEKQNFISLYLRVQGSPASGQKEMLDKLPPGRRAHWTEEMNRWQALPESERAELCAYFQRFCALSGEEQKETAGPLSDSDRQAMEKSLRAFDRLPPEQRTQCINSFRKFASMGPEERAQFLNNAARWQAMTKHQRQLWRELVQTLPAQPPLPPGLLPMPPMPPQTRRSRPAQPLPPMPPSVTAPVIIALSTNAAR